MAADHFCLIWNNFQNSILSALGNLQSSQDLVDVTLMCEGKNVRAHKVILSACSPYFRNLFKETPCQHPVIILKDVSHYDLTALLQFMYQGEVMVTQDCLASFLKTAELLQISGLAGTTPNTSTSETSDHPPRPPDPLDNPPDSPNTVINKINSELSLTKQKKPETKELKETVEKPFETDPPQSCSYQQTPSIMIKTESLDRDYEDMISESMEMKDMTEEHFDNTSSHSEEPSSILERSLKAQSDMITGSSKRMRTMRDVADSKPQWNSSRPAQCPYCLTMIKQARNMNRHIKYYCPSANTFGQESLQPQIELKIEEGSELKSLDSASEGGT